MITLTPAAKKAMPTPLHLPCGAERFHRSDIFGETAAERSANNAANTFGDQRVTQPSCSRPSVLASPKRHDR